MKPSKQNAFTLIEVLISMLLLAIVLSGGITLFFHANDISALVLHKKMAMEEGSNGIEYLKNMDYSALWGLADPINQPYITNMTVGQIEAQTTRTLTRVTPENRVIANIMVTWTDPSRTSSPQEMTFMTQIAP